MKKVFGAIVFCTFFYSCGSERQLTAEQIESIRQSSPIQHFRDTQLRREENIGKGYYPQRNGLPGAFSPRAISNNISKDKKEK